MEPQKNKHNTENKKEWFFKNSYIYWKSLPPLEKFTFGLLVFTAVYALISYNSLKQAVRGVDIAENTLKQIQENARLDQRAWVGPIVISVVELKAGSIATFEIQIGNLGKTPALKNGNKIGIYGYYPTEKFVPHYFHEPYSISVIQPNQRLLEWAKSSVPLTKEMIDSFENGNSVYYVYGELLYEDIWKQPHSTHFCQYLAKDLKNFLNCGVYNDAD